VIVIVIRCVLPRFAGRLLVVELTSHCLCSQFRMTWVYGTGLDQEEVGHGFVTEAVRRGRLNVCMYWHVLP